MARLSLFCIFIVLVIVSIARIDAGSRIARSPQFGRPYGPPPPPPPPPQHFGPWGPRNVGPGNPDPGCNERFEHNRHGHHNNRDSDYDVPPGGSISISKTISISSGGNAQSSAGSSAGSGGSTAGSSSSSSASAN